MKLPVVRLIGVRIQKQGASGLHLHHANAVELERGCLLVLQGLHVDAMPDGPDARP